MQKTKKSVKKTKQKSRKMQPYTKVVCAIILAISAYLLFNVAKEVYTTITLQQQLAEVQSKLQEVQDENNYLTEQKEKLQDPDYVESYARGNYQLSKDGEQIFYLPENNKK